MGWDGLTASSPTSFQEIHWNAAISGERVNLLPGNLINPHNLTHFQAHWWSLPILPLLCVSVLTFWPKCTEQFHFLSMLLPLLVLSSYHFGAIWVNDWAFNLKFIILQPLLGGFWPMLMLKVEFKAQLNWTEYLCIEWVVESFSFAMEICGNNF